MFDDQGTGTGTEDCARYKERGADLGASPLLRWTVVPIVTSWHLTESSKLGAGIIKHHSDGSTTVLSNVRRTYIAPPGEGFLPQDTARHHREWIHSLVKDSLKQADVEIRDLRDWVTAAPSPFQLFRPLFLQGPFVHSNEGWFLRLKTFS